MFKILDMKKEVRVKIKPIPDFETKTKKKDKK